MYTHGTHPYMQALIYTYEIKKITYYYDPLNKISKQALIESPVGAKTHIITDSAKADELDLAAHTCQASIGRGRHHGVTFQTLSVEDREAGREGQYLFLASKERLAECVTKTGNNVGKEKKGEGPAQAQY